MFFRWANFTLGVADMVHLLKTDCFLVWCLTNTLPYLCAKNLHPLVPETRLLVPTEAGVSTHYFGYLGRLRFPTGSEELLGAEKCPVA